MTQTKIRGIPRPTTTHKGEAQPLAREDPNLANTKHPPQKKGFIKKNEAEAEKPGNGKREKGREKERHTTNIRQEQAVPTLGSPTTKRLTPTT